MGWICRAKKSMCFIKCTYYFYLCMVRYVLDRKQTVNMFSYRHFTWGMDCIYVDNDFAIIDYPQRAYNVIYLTVYIFKIKAHIKLQSVYLN